MSFKRIPNISLEQSENEIVSFVSNIVKSTGTSGVVLGLSGGLDSAVCAALCAKACKTIAVIMPDSEVTPNSEIVDAQAVASAIGIEPKIIDIGPKISNLVKDIEYTKDSVGNIRARVRMLMLYNEAKVGNYLVAGTSDKSEFFTGYFTKYGDGASDIAPIAGIYKTHVRQMAKHLGIPSNIIEKKSAPYITDNRTAEDELGLTYDEIDSILHCMVEKGMTNKQTVEDTSIESAKVTIVRRLYESSDHKRSGPLGVPR